MARKELNVAPREVTGKKVATLRREGLLPANIYGHGVSSLSVQVEKAVLEATIRVATANEVLDLKVVGERLPRSVVLHHVQRNPLTSSILHADFYQISLLEKMRADVPLTLVGTSDAVFTYKGVLLAGTEYVHIEALPLDIPSHFEVDIAQMTELDAAIHVRDLSVPAGVTILTDGDVVVARVASPSVAEAADVVAAPVAAPEPPID